VTRDSSAEGGDRKGIRISGNQGAGNQDIWISGNGGWISLRAADKEKVLQFFPVGLGFVPLEIRVLTGVVRIEEVADGRAGRK